MARVLTWVFTGLIGYSVGYLSGLIIGAVIWYKRAQRLYKDDLLLEQLDTYTDWDYEEDDEEEWR